MKTIIVQLERTLPDGIVTTIHWRCEKGETSTYGLVSLPKPDKKMIPFEELTETIVTQWLRSQVNMNQIESSLDEHNDEITNPKTATGLPWEAQADELPS
jgi:hypothetical protein